MAQQSHTPRTAGTQTRTKSTKRIVIGSLINVIVIALIAVFAVFAVRRNTGSSASSSASTSASSASGASSFSRNGGTNTMTNGKTAIVYFSLTGTTENAAKQIQKRVPGSTLIRIEAQEAYGDYDSAAHRGDRERRQNIHPALKSVPDLSSYTNVFIGFPTWWAQPPMLIDTLFDKVDFSGKTIIPFTTSMSTPMSESMPTMRRLAKADNAKITDGFRYDNDNQALESWLRRIGFFR